MYVVSYLLGRYQVKGNQLKRIVSWTFKAEMKWFEMTALTGKAFLGFGVLCRSWAWRLQISTERNLIFCQFQNSLFCFKGQRL